MRTLKSRLQSNRGSANTIEMLFVVFILFCILMTVLDLGIYFNNRYIVSNAAQNGARLAAVFGGTNANPISKKYGITTVDLQCSSMGADNPVACSVYKELQNSTNSVNTNITKITCGPGRTNRVGDRTYCEIGYRYNGLPGSGLSLAKFFGDFKVRMTAESEVIHK